MAAVDVKRTLFGRREVWTHSGTTNLGVEPARIFLADAAFRRRGTVRAIDRPGRRPSGYDVALLQELSAAVTIPVIACGGAGSIEDMKLLLRSTRVAAAAAGTMFVLHGKHKAPLISYPRADEIAALGAAARGVP